MASPLGHVASLAETIGEAATDSLPNGYRHSALLEFRILGPLEVVGERGPISLAGPRQRATLAILLLNANRVVSVDRLADQLYAGAPPVTAVTQVQRQVSELRRLLGSPAVIETRPPGYIIRLSSDQLDVDGFEHRIDEGSRALARGEVRAAAHVLREALALWRGPPLADLGYEPFSQTAIARLEELRLVALEYRIEADLRLGRDADLVPELEGLTAEHPLHERFCGQLMLALYRAGRQSQALDVYRQARTVLSDDLGLEPAPELQELHRAILGHDPTLAANHSAASPTGRVEQVGAILVFAGDEEHLEALVSIAEPLARLPERELILVQPVGNEAELQPASSALSARRASLAVPARTATFTTLDPGGDVVRLVAANDVILVLVSAPPEPAGARLPDHLTSLLEQSPADVALLAGGPAASDATTPVFVPFGGGEHDWAALEVGGWLALALGVPLRLVGRKADPERGQRDASRLLADASLAVQRLAGIDAGPLLVESFEDLLEVVEDASVAVMGLSTRWRNEGLGPMRQAFLRDPRRPTLLVRSGPRPGGLAPPDSRTRFTWSLGH
jgi:DNA-binding SARP family transcriptional activator